MTFGERLRHLRERKEWSQGQLGYKIGVNNETIYRWEYDIRKPSCDNLIKLSDIFGCSTDFLLGRG